MTNAKTKVGVLYGGTSNEREVSLASGKVVLEQLPPDRFEVTGIEIAADGSWQIPLKDCKQFEVIFIALHGGDGEGGKVQAQLDSINVPYTGSDARASARALDKIESTRIATETGLAVPKELTLAKPTTAHDEIISFGLPAVLKPTNGGSSVGVSIVTQPDQIEAAVATAYDENSTVLVQEYITGRELTCGVLGNHSSELTALPPVEIIAASGFFNYHAKYQAADTQELCPAPLTDTQTAELQRQAVAIHRALGCDGLTRSDFIMDKGGAMYYLETNTIPGMTPTSLCPKEAIAAGLSLAELFTRQIDLALERAAAS